MLIKSIGEGDHIAIPSSPRLGNWTPTVSFTFLKTLLNETALLSPSMTTTGQTEYYKIKSAVVNIISDRVDEDFM